MNDITNPTSAAPPIQGDVNPGLFQDARPMFERMDATKTSGVGKEQTDGGPGTPDPWKQLWEETPEKFRKAEIHESYAAVLSAYKALEQKLSAQASTKQQESSASKQAKPPSGEGDTSAAGGGPHITKVLEDVSGAFFENGKLGDTEYNALASVGISKEIADRYVAAHTAASEAAVREAVAEAGGEETLKALLAHAETNLAAEEREAVSKMLGSFESKKIKAAVRMLKASHIAAGNMPLTTLAGSEAGVAKVITSRKELQEAISAPEYWEESPRGEKYRLSVANALKNGLIRG